MTNHHAGSATGIDLNMLEALAEHIAERGLRSAANELRRLIAEARATPQHPETPADGERAPARALPDGWIALSIQYNGQEDETEEVAYGPKIMMDRLGKWLDKYFERVIADRDAATPQHSVTEQDERTLLRDALKRLEDANDVLCGLRTGEQYLSMLDGGQKDALYELDNARFAARALLAQPLASTAASEPEQTVSVIYPPDLPKFMPGFPFDTQEELWDHAVLTGWRAAQPALAIPASTAHIPTGVYYSEEHDNFYGGNGQGMGQGFYERWEDRNLEFPASTAASERLASEGYNAPLDVFKYTADRANKEMLKTFQMLHPAASEQQAGADELDMGGDLIEMTSHLSEWGAKMYRASNTYKTCERCGGFEAMVGMRHRLYRAQQTIRKLAALTHRATTATPGHAGVISAGEYDRATGTMYVTVKLPKDGLPVELLTIGSAVSLAAAPDIATTAADQQGDTASASVDTPEFRMLLERHRHCARWAADAAAEQVVAYIDGRAQQGAAQAQAEAGDDAACWREVVKRIGYRETEDGPHWVIDLTKPTRWGNTDTNFIAAVRAAMAAPATSNGEKNV